MRHHGRYLALEEGTPAYEVTANLETVGRFDLDGMDAAGPLVPGGANDCGYVRDVLSPDAGTIDIPSLHDAVADFPRIDDPVLGRSQRYSVLTAVSGNNPHVVGGEHVSDRPAGRRPGPVRHGRCDRRADVRATTRGD